MRISRGNQIIGEWSLAQVNKRMIEASLLATDLYYDEDSSEWMPLGGLVTKAPAPKHVAIVQRSCYCGSGLPFNVCHGDGVNY